MFADQSPFAVRFDWGLAGLRATAANAIVVIIDILSFTTSVSIACSCGATITPCEWSGNAKRISSESLLTADENLQLVLATQNGSALSHEATRSGHRVVAASIRNATAVAQWLNEQDARIAVIASGERWPDNTWRFAAEDLIGAGAVITQLRGSRSPEAATAVAAFNGARHSLLDTLRACSSGRELALRGFDADIALAAAIDADLGVPLIIDGAYQDARYS